VSVSSIDLAELDEARAVYDLRYAESRRLLGELVMLLEKERSIEAACFIVQASTLVYAYKIAIENASTALLTFGARLQAIGAQLVAQGEVAGTRAAARMAAPPGRRH